MDVETGWLLTTAGLVPVLVGVAGLWIWRVRQQQRQRLETMTHMTQTLEQQRELIETLLRAATLLDQRITKLERKGFDLEQRQENLEQLGLNERYQDRSYGEAIQMVRRGSNAQRLVEELGLSRNEAELIVMLHGASTTKLHH
ncbi:MAG: DUF2802 domain-containing protein [Pseudomonadota bacterium]